MIRRAVILGVIACALGSGATAGAATRPPKEDPPIDSASALAGLEAVIAAHPSSGYAAVVIDVCPMVRRSTSLPRLQFEVTLETNDGSVTAPDAAAAMRAVLPDLATALAANA